MSKPRLYKSFSQLIETYRKKRDYSIKDVYIFLNFNCEWHISYDAIRKFDRGLREPDPEYVILLKKCLGLTEQQYESLLEAIVGDYKAALYETYKQATRKLIKQGCLNAESVV